MRAVFILLLVVAAEMVWAQPDSEALEREVLLLLHERFEDAELDYDHVRAFVRVFSTPTERVVITRTDMMGARQQPRRISVPRAGGIVLRFYVGEGEYQGAALLPHNAKRVHSTFTERHVIRNAPDAGSHVWAQILTPREDAPEEIATELVELFNYFHLYVE